MRATKRGKKVVKSNSVGQVDDGHLCAPLVSFSMEQVVVANSDVEQMTSSDPRGICVIVLGVRGWDMQKSGTELGCRARIWNTYKRRRVDTATEQSCFKLLIGA